MHGWRIGLDPAHHVDRLGYRLGPVFGTQRKCAAGLGLRHKHAVQSNIHHTHARWKVFNRTRHPAFESVLPLDMKRDGNGFPRLNGKLSGLRRHQHIGRRNYGSELQRRARVRYPDQIVPGHARVPYDLYWRRQRSGRGVWTRGKNEYSRSLSRRNRSLACRDT